jgi:hypothetical protein
MICKRCGGAVDEDRVNGWSAAWSDVTCGGLDHDVGNGQTEKDSPWSKTVEPECYDEEVHLSPESFIRLSVTLQCVGTSAA